MSAAMRAPGGGWISISVNKAEGYSADNPVFLVKGKNADGTPFEAGQAPRLRCFQYLPKPLPFSENSWKAVSGNE